MKNDNDLLKVQDICKILGIHQNTVYRLVKNDKLPYIKIGKLYRFNKNDILKLIQNKKIN